ncbi:MAG: glycerol-3-phosphate 1-O-acyltransferase PlsY [Bacteroidota bacterium]
MLPLSIVILLSYMVGSIPTSIIITKLSRNIDIREHGSGNAGGTNVIRVLGLREGLFVIVLDFLKGYAAPMLVARLMVGPFPFNNRTPFEDYTVVQIIAGCSAILGHVWTMFGGFRGGKGIATACGVLIGLAPVEMTVSLTIFLIVFVISGYVSLGSISASMAFPLAMLLRHNVFHADLYGYHTLIYFSIGITMLLIYTHRANIKRLKEGTEHKLTDLKFVKKSP